MRGAKVHLHCHLDGAFRPSTLFELAQRKGLAMPGGAKTAEELAAHCRVPKNCTSLVEFLTAFPFMTGTVNGDGDAVERVAYELCEDQAADGVVYFEARFAPHLLASESLRVEDVVERVLRGLHRGQAEFGVQARVILCCLRHAPENSDDVVRVAAAFQGRGVVGIDIAGNEALPTEPHIHAFDEAHRIGLNITAHAGEACGAERVKEAMDVLHATRVGHGYRVLEDASVYDLVRRRQVHLEVCLTSSIQTGAVFGGRAALRTHPVLRFAADRVNYGLNVDDPTVCDTTMTSEVQVALDEVGLPLGEVGRAMVCAARSAFLPAAERDDLVHRVQASWEDESRRCC